MQERITLSNFLSAFFPAEEEPLHLFGFDAKKLPEPLRRKPYYRRTSRHELKTNPELQRELKTVNHEQGLYFTVNAGGTKREEITRINAVFCEIDDRPIEVQHDLFDSCHYPPSIRNETRKSVHAYWLLEEDFTVSQFETIQHGLIENFQADKAINNPNRVMRMPFFNHVAFDMGEYLYKPVHLHTFEPGATFTFAELNEAFPVKEREAVHVPKTTYKGETREAVMQELRWRISQIHSYRIEPNGEWGTAKGVCHNGESNTALTVNLRGGEVSCKAGCSYAKILDSFGLRFPESVKAKFVPRNPQQSKTYKWLKDYIQQQKIEEVEESNVETSES